MGKRFLPGLGGHFRPVLDSFDDFDNRSYLRLLEKGPLIISLGEFIGPPSWLKTLLNYYPSPMFEHCRSKKSNSGLGVFLLKRQLLSSPSARSWFGESPSSARQRLLFESGEQAAVSVCWGSLGKVHPL